MPYIIPNHPKNLISVRKRRNFHSSRGGFRSSIPGKYEDTNLNFPWVSNDILNKSYAISIRVARYNSFQKRMGPWASNVEKISGINGHELNVHELHKSNFIERTSLRMKRGKIGCYMSHRIVWNNIIEKQHKMTLILEDDVNLVHSKLHSEKLIKALESLAIMPPDQWDIAYLCYNPRGKTQSIVGNLDFVKTNSWHVLYGYVVSLRGAEILLKHSLPISVAVDVYMGNLAKRSRIKAVRLKQAICTVKYSGSDTEGIL